MAPSIPHIETSTISLPGGMRPTFQHSRPEVADLTAAAKSSEVISIQGTDTVPIVIRCFAREAPRSPVIMLHGLQSHSGWFSQSAQFISHLGHPVYAVERRGSGLSPAPKGDIDRFDQIVDDIKVVHDHIKKNHDFDQAHIFGHCFGAIPALAMACRHPGAVLSIILTSPAIYTHTDLTLAGKVRVMMSHALSGNPYIPVPLEPGDFTDIPDIRAFIAHDPVALREATARFWFAVYQMRRYVKGAKKFLSLPLFAAFSARDRVSVIERNIRFICSLPSGIRWLITYERSGHILEFGEDRDVFFRDAALWLARWE